jgi:hypothetical protein
MLINVGATNCATLGDNSVIFVSSSFGSSFQVPW